MFNVVVYTHSVCPWSDERRLQNKTRLLEVQLQIHGHSQRLVVDGRFFVYNRQCQMKRGGLISKRYKQIQIYLFNDLFLWVSARGKFKGSYSFYAEDLQIEIPSDCKKGDALFSIGLQKEKHKRLIVCADDMNRDKMMDTVLQTYRQCQEKYKKTLEGTDKPAIHRLKKKSVRETTVKDTDISFSPSSVDTRNLREYSVEESDLSAANTDHNGSGVFSPPHVKQHSGSNSTGFDDSHSKSAKNGQSYSHLPQIKGV